MKKKIILIIIISIPSIVLALNLDESKDLMINSVIGPKSSEVEIYWDSMSFIYINNLNYEWNSNTHKYDLSNNGYWQSNDNNIRFKNNSTYDINVNLECSLDNSYGNLGYSFDKNNLNIESNKEDSVKLILNGSLNDNFTSVRKVGTVSIAIE